MKTPPRMSQVWGLSQPCGCKAKPRKQGSIHRTEVGRCQVQRTFLDCWAHLCGISFREKALTHESCVVKKACVPGDFSKSSGAQKSHRQGDSWKRKDDWTSSYHATEQFASLRFVLEKRFGLWALISVYLYIHTYIHSISCIRIILQCVQFCLSSLAQAWVFGAGGSWLLQVSRKSGCSY